MTHADFEVASDGRWHGALGSRPAPTEREPLIDALSADDRAALTFKWLGQSAAERRASDAFAVIHRDLVAVRAPTPVVEIARRAVDDERRHAAICHHVAERIAGRTLAIPATPARAVPAHARAPASLLPTLHIVGQCVLNETTASAYLEASLQGATSPIARWGLREALSDKIDHARIGWAHLAALDAATKRAVAPWLLSMVRGNLKM